MKRKISKIIISFLLTLVMVVGLMPGMSMTAYAAAHTHNDITFTAWTSNDSLPTAAGSYYLANDVTIDSTWNVPTGTTNLCLNGHGILMNRTNRVIHVSSGCTLNLYDCGTETVHKFTVNNPSAKGAGLATVNDSLESGYQTFTGGYITGGKAEEGGGVYVDGGTFNMAGGNIIGNKATAGGYYDGGGVSLSNNASSRFVMTSGAIQHNTSTGRGPALGIANNATVELTGDARITHNSRDNNGWCGAISSYGTLTISGNVQITNNRGQTALHPQAGSVNISGSPVIFDNEVSAGDIHLDITLNIVGELTEGAKLGVYWDNAKVFTNSTDTSFNDVSKFVSDNPNLSVVKDADEQLSLRAEYAVTLDRSSATVAAGSVQALMATVTPQNATDKKVVWSVSGDAVKLYTDEDCTTEVGTEATENLTVYAKGISAGSATVTATSNADSNKSASCDVTVNAAPADPTPIVITSSNFNEYFDTNGVLKDTVPAESVLDFQGEFLGDQYNLTINKKVTVTSTSNPVAKFDGTSTDDPTKNMTFSVVAGADYTTISNLEFLNCRLDIQGSTHVTVDNINISVKDKRVGSGVGFISIYGGASYAVIKNSHIEATNNGGTSCVVLGKGADHVTFENNTAKASGNVGNMFAINIFNLPGDTNPGYITFKNNNLENENESGSSLSNGIMLCGEGNTIEGNTIKWKGTAIGVGFGVTSTIWTYKNNTITDGNVSVTEGAIFTGNTVGGNLTVSGKDTQIEENTINKNVTINSNNTKFIKNDVTGTVTVNANSKGNTITENSVVSTGEYAVILKSKASDSNTSVENNTLVSKDKLGDDAVNPGTGSGNTIQNNNGNGYTALQDEWIQSIADMTYTGEALEPEVVVKNGNTTLTLGTDYQVAYKDNKNVGTATVTITRTEGSSYGGKAEKTFTINKAASTPATVAEAARTYDGTEKPLVNVDNSTLVGGEMQYALGTKDAANEEYTTTIPTKTNAGT